MISDENIVFALYMFEQMIFKIVYIEITENFKKQNLMRYDNNTKTKLSKN